MKHLLTTALAIACWLGAVRIGSAQYTISTVAGSTSVRDNGPATKGLLSLPIHAAFDGNGNLLVADSANNRIRKIDTSGNITTVAGAGTPGFSGDGGPATSAQLNNPTAVAVDAAGNLYIYDSFNYVIRKINSTGVISTYAGTPAVSGTAGDNGAATAAQLALNSVGGLAADTAGNLYLTTNNKVRKINGSTGIITTFAGNGLSPSSANPSAGDGGQATNASMNPAGIAPDPAGNLYIADYGTNRIRKVNATTGVITSVAGGGHGGDGGPATSASLAGPFDVALDAQQNMFIAEAFASKIRKVTAATNMISTFAGNGIFGFQGDGGPATSAELFVPFGVVDKGGNVYIMDSNNDRIRIVSGTTINTLAGDSHNQGDGGPATEASLFYPQAVAQDSSGNLLIADTDNGLIRQVTPAGTISALISGFSAGGVAVDGSGNVYFSAGSEVLKMGSNGVITPFAGQANNPGLSGDNGPATAAQLNLPTGLALDSMGNLFIADQRNHRVRKVSGGKITTVAGSGKTFSAADNFYGGGFGGDTGPATAAQLAFPIGVGFDNMGNLLIADTNNSRIRKVDSGGIIRTIAGGGGSLGDGGPALSAALRAPTDVVSDRLGNLFISDTNNERVRMINTSGIISTIAGTGVRGYSGDGGPGSSANLDAPWGIAVDVIGDVFFPDETNHLLRELAPPAPAGLSAASGGNQNGSPGTTLASPLVVKVTGTDGKGIPGVPVNFMAANSPSPQSLRRGSQAANGPNATLSASTVTTASDGTASVQVTLGSTPGNIAITASFPFTQPVTFNETIVGPVFTAAGVDNAASFASGSLVPGGIATIFGTDLTSSNGINLASSLPLPSDLLNVSVLVNGSPAPLFAVDSVNGQQQINFQVPWELAGQPSAMLQVVNNGVSSSMVNVPVVAAQPGLFAYTIGNNTFGAITHANGQTADTGHPAARGEVVLIYCTGLGALAQAQQDGVAAAGADGTVAQPTVMMGGQIAAIDYSGLSPTFVGLYQINAHVPSGLSGNEPVVVKIGNASSNTVLLPVG